MGLNYVRRGRREDLDSPNDFVTAAIGERDINFKEHDQQLILDFQDDILTKTRQRIKDLNFD